MWGVRWEEGRDVVEGGDGSTAIRLVDENPSHVMLLDIPMPGVTGVEVLRHLRSRRRTRTLPVLVVSAYPRVLTPDDEASVACVLTKPLRIDKLLAAVRQALEPHGLLEAEVTLADVGSLVALPSLTYTARRRNPPIIASPTQH